MSVLILGASGATGKLLLSFLVLQNIKVKIILRKGAFLEDDFIKHENVEIIRTNVYDLSKEDISLILSDVKSVFSCLVNFSLEYSSFKTIALSENTYFSIAW